MSACIIKNCNSRKTRAGVGVKFYSVPSFTKKPELALKWTVKAKEKVKDFYVEATASMLNPRPDRQLEFEKSYVLNTSIHKVCELHFAEDCFEVDLRAKLMNNIIKKKLIEGAIPTVYGTMRDSDGLQNSCKTLKTVDFMEDGMDSLVAGNVYVKMLNKETQTRKIGLNSIATQTEKKTYKDCSTSICKPLTELKILNVNLETVVIWQDHE